MLNEDEAAAEPSYVTLEGMEAYWLLIIAVSFEALCVQDNSSMQCSKQSITDGHLIAAREIVKSQRAAYIQRARELNDDV